MARVWQLPIDLNNPQDRQVATWLAAQSDPAAAVKRLILDTVAGKDSSDQVLDLLPIILKELRELRAESHSVQVDGQPDPSHEKVFRELRALRADLARVGPKELGKVTPPPEDPESAQRLDTLFRE